MLKVSAQVVLGLRRRGANQVGHFLLFESRCWAGRIPKSFEVRVVCRRVPVAQHIVGHAGVPLGSILAAVFDPSDVFVVLDTIFKVC